MALIRQTDSHLISGAAIIYSRDGYLLSVDSALGKRPEVVLPDGSRRSPIRVATDRTTGLTLLKVAANGLVAAQLTSGSVNRGDRVFAAGFDQTDEAGQIAGYVTAADPASPADAPALINTGMSATPGFNGGALATESGQVIGITTSDRQASGESSVAAIPSSYVENWLGAWRAGNEQVLEDSASWPELKAGLDVTLFYPAGWSLSNRSRDGRTFHGEIAPADPDVPAKLSISIEPTDFQGDPMVYAEKAFGGEADAVIWGRVVYGQIPGVRVLVNQEGARVDVVYLFARGLRIGVNLTAGYSISDTGPQEQRVTALFEGVLRSITLNDTNATPTP